MPPDLRAVKTPTVDGAELLDEVADQLGRYVAFPSESCLTAVALWSVHCHAPDASESSPRLVLTSPDPGCGKTRVIEVLERLVPNPMNMMNATVAALFRRIGDGITVLMDEADTYLGAKTADKHEELRGLVNAGHRRGAVAWRCVGEPASMRVVAFPAYAPVALAAVRDLPETIMQRAVVVRMRRRAPDEHVTPFRSREAEPALRVLRDRLAVWCEEREHDIAAARPLLPDGLTDRPADVWEPLLAVAETAGGAWPERARAAAAAMALGGGGAEPSLGVLLLADVRDVFGDADKLATEDLLERLNTLEESPWGDLRGRPLDPRRLSRILGDYGVESTKVRIGERTPRGYLAEDLHDPWRRYLPASPQEAEHVEHAEQPRSEGGSGVPHGSHVPEHVEHGGTRNRPVTSVVPHVPHVPQSDERGPGAREAGDARAGLLAEKQRREHTLDLDGTDQ